MPLLCIALFLIPSVIPPDGIRQSTNIARESMLLHTSERNIVNWVKQGGVPLSEDMKGCPWFFSLQNFDKYKESKQERIPFAISRSEQV
jgi:hypothetical protein